MNTNQAARFSQINELERVLVGTFGFELKECSHVHMQDAVKIRYTHKTGASALVMLQGRTRMSVTHCDTLGVRDFPSIPAFLSAVEAGF